MAAMLMLSLVDSGSPLPLAGLPFPESGNRMTLEVLLISLPVHIPRTDLLSLTSAVFDR